MNRRPSPLQLCVALALAHGCDHDHAVPAGSPCADPQQVSLPDCEGSADRFSDEACAPLDDAIRNSRATASDARAPSIASPTEMQSLPAATPFTFAWTAPTAMRLRRRPMTARDELRRWVTLVPEAEAHCSPFTGCGYELRITAGGRVILRRQQSATSWTPTAPQWAYLAGAIGAQTAELAIYTALYTNNQINTGNGPFTASAPRRFTLAR